MCIFLYDVTIPWDEMNGRAMIGIYFIHIVQMHVLQREKKEDNAF
jgi:hypothetical protein